MKKKLLIVLGVLFLPLASFQPVNAAETEVFADQYYTPPSGGNSTISTYGWGQTFVPTVNRLSSVHMGLVNRQGGTWLDVTVQDKDTGEVIFSAGHRMDDGDGWESFYFYPKLEIVPGNEHTILLEASQTQTGWMYSSTWTPYYADGSREQNGTPYSGDFAFSVWGSIYTQDPPPEDPPPEDPPPEDPPPEDPGEDNGQDATVQDGDPEENGQETDQNGGTQPRGKTDDMQMPESEDVNAPELGDVKVNGEDFDLSGGDILELAPGDTLEVSGTADPNATVVVFIGDDAYPTTADEDGNWTVKIGIGELPAGDYTVKAQAQDDEGNGSEIVELFDISVTGDTAEDTDLGAVGTSETPTNDTFWGKILVGEYMWYAIVFLVLLFGAVVGFGFYYESKEKKKKKN